MDKPINHSADSSDDPDIKSTVFGSRPNKIAPKSMSNATFEDSQLLLKSDDTTEDRNSDVLFQMYSVDKKKGN